MRRDAVTADTPIERIAILTNDALGNFVVATPMMQMVRARHPNAIVHYYGGTRIHELSRSAAYLDESIPWLGTPLRVAASKLPEPYDWVINIEHSPWMRATVPMLAKEDGVVTGPALKPDGRGDLPFDENAEGRIWADQEWLSTEVTHRHPELKSGHISEIFARIAGLDGPIPKYSLPAADPERPVPDVLIATTASLPDKLWDTDDWMSLCSLLQGAGLSIGLLGAKPSVQGQFWLGADDESRIAGHAGVEDLRGTLTLPQVVGAIERAKLVVTLDNGIMHFACATSTPVVGMFREGIHRLWAPPVENLLAVVTEPKADVAAIPFSEVERNVKIALGNF
ncbi:MAG: glycosyltransferase family 9 protein [Fimbriimonadaceae bacterium]|nr:glycosyltransferase family 9 protein [Fimbriimonadaceae bacterium]